MIHLRKLASAVCLASLLASWLAVSNAQTVDATTGNVLVPGQWTGTVPGEAGGLSGGSTPAFNPSTNTIIFGYTQRTTTQTFAVNQALSAAGTGIRLSGYNYSWQIDNSGMNSGTLTGAVNLRDSAGAVISSQLYDYNAPTNGFELKTGTYLYTNPYELSTVGNMSVEFTGKDSRFWAGYYGPRVREPSLSLIYTQDPCALNPASSPTCPGFNDLLTSINIVPYPNGSATEGYPLINSFPIATALSNSGTGLALHGFRYGFSYELGAQRCSTGLDIFGICLFGDMLDNTAEVTVGITNKQNSILYANVHSRTGSNTSGSSDYMYLFPQSTNTSLMGDFIFEGRMYGSGRVYNMYSKLIVTPDQCTTNPYSSTSCSGFTEAINKAAGTNTTDYATTGYTEPASVTAGTSSSTAIAYTTSPSGSNVEVVPTPTTVSSSGTSVTFGAAVSSPTSTTTASSTPTTKVGEVTDSAKSAQPATSTPSSGGGVSLSTILNIVSNEQSRIGNVERSVVQQAVEQSVKESERTQREAEKRAEQIQQQSIATSTQTQQTAQPQTMFSLTVQAGPVMGGFQQQQNMGGAQGIGINFFSPGMVSGIGLSAFRQDQSNQNNTVRNEVFRQENVGNVSRAESFSFSTPTFSYSTESSRTFQLSEVDLPRQDSPRFGGARPLIEEIGNTRPIIPSGPASSTTDTVKKDVPNNELAGGVDITSIARQPVNFAQYNVGMPDSAFYTPKEIYRNQRTVDNARVLRGLMSGSDRLHQEMVDQQYKK
jgi:hypothetical protein